MSTKIFFGNYKGGVGKTTTVFEIGALLAEHHNKKVLLVDLDPQCSLSKICSRTSNVALELLDVEETFNFTLELYSEYINSVSKINILENNIETRYEIVKNSIKRIKKYSNNNGELDFIPTVLDMKNSRLNDISDRMSKNTINILVIAKLLSDIDNNNEYDYILFDCPPTSNIIIQSVFLSCDYYLIPTVGDEISSDGVADYITEIESTYLKFAYDNNIGGLLLKKYFGDKPVLIGVLETLFKARRPSEANLPVLEALDKSISKIGIRSKITGTKHVAENRKHIFKKYIRHLDNRSDPNNYGMPITISNGDIHEEYVQVVDALIDII
ncbi:MAG: AAA family ATPase [Bacillota bacterium]|nr:AAA family ATPase [Bacillota bacterium]